MIFYSSSEITENLSALKELHTVWFGHVKHMGTDYLFYYERKIVYLRQIYKLLNFELDFFVFKKGEHSMLPEKI